MRDPKNSAQSSKRLASDGPKNGNRRHGRVRASAARDLTVKQYLSDSLNSEISRYAEDSSTSARSANLIATQKSEYNKSEENLRQYFEQELGDILDGLDKLVDILKGLSEHQLAIVQEFAEVVSDRPAVNSQLPKRPVPERPPELYKDRPRGENGPDFVRRVYGDWDGWMSRADLSRLDLSAANALTNWEQYHQKKLDLLRVRPSSYGGLPDISDELAREAGRINMRVHRIRNQRADQ